MEKTKCLKKCGTTPQNFKVHQCTLFRAMYIVNLNFFRMSLNNSVISNQLQPNLRGELSRVKLCHEFFWKENIKKFQAYAGGVRAACAGFKLQAKN